MQTVVRDLGKTVPYLGELAQVPQTFLALDVNRNVGAVEGDDEASGVLYAECLHDIGAHGGRGGSRQRGQRHVREVFLQVAQLFVIGAEIVPPGRNAVRLVNDESRE